MRGVQFLNLVAMPLAAAMPHLAWSTAPKHIEKRFTLIDDSQFHFEPAVLTNVGMECTRPTAADMYACQLRFDWYDPNSVKENDVNFCSCISKWSWDGNTTESGDKNTYNTEYSVCLWELPVSFKMRFYAFNSSQDFRLELAHHYQDSENFPPPWEYPTTFATPVLHLPIVKREDNLMRLYDAGPINATIVGISD